MTSTVSPGAWMQAAIVRSLHTSAKPTAGGRHRAPELPGTVEYLTSAQIAAGPGRHAAPERDVVDAFDWLRFAGAPD